MSAGLRPAASGAPQPRARFSAGWVQAEPHWAAQRRRPCLLEREEQELQQRESSVPPLAELAARPVRRAPATIREAPRSPARRRLAATAPPGPAPAARAQQAQAWSPRAWASRR